ncbi:MAG: PfkB family carbohydrate kinase, partial [Bacteroidales bacterium]
MEYKKIFNRFDGLNILIIGDVMIDSYMWGKVDRISPEAPVPIATIVKTEDRLGGAANVALNIKAMGANPILCSVVGHDPKAKSILSLMKKLNITKDGILLSRERETTVKTRILGNKVQMLRVDQEITTPLSEKDEKDFIDSISNI